MREEIRVPKEGDEHLVQVRLEGEARGRSNGHDGVVFAGTGVPAPGAGEEDPDAGSGSQHAHHTRILGELCGTR